MLVLNFKELKQKRIQNKNKKQRQVGFYRWLVYFKFIQIISYSGQYLLLVINCWPFVRKRMSHAILSEWTGEIWFDLFAYTHVIVHMMPLPLLLHKQFIKLK